MWHVVKADDRVNAVVLRAAGERAFSAGLDTSKSFGQPDLVWNHDDPGEFLSPKWQKCWKPVVCAVHGMCTAGALYFVNEADVVICSDDATFFDSHVTYGYVSAIEPIGLMRRIGLGDTLRMALMGNRERVSARDGAAARAGDRGRSARPLWDTRHELARVIASYPAVATQGTVRAIWESLDKPYRAAMEQGLMYTRLGNPVGLAGDPAAPASTARRRRFDERPIRERHPGTSPRGDGARPVGARARVRGHLVHLGRAGGGGRRGRRGAPRRGLGAGSPVGLMLRNRPVRARHRARTPARRRLRGHGEPSARRRTAPRRRPRSRAPAAARRAPTTSRCSLPTSCRRPRGVSSVRSAHPIAVTRLGRSPAVVEAPGVAVRMLTSGTTGPPKRIDLRYEMLDQVMRGAKHYETGTGSDVRLRSGVVIVNAPLVHVSGVFRVVQAVLDGRRIALLERFSVDGWVAAVREHRPKTVSLVPTALRMVLDADVDDDVFESIRSVVSGTAPLDPDLAEAFTARYGVPVLTSYGATEFGGGVAGWNLADHEQFAAAKRGSVGRAHAGCSLRVVDPDDGTDLGLDAVGLLEVRAAQLGTDDWVRTTDLARVDADGFLWIVGPRRPDHPPRRVQGPARGGAGRARAASRRGRGRGGRASTTSASARCRWPRSNGDRVPTLDEAARARARGRPPGARTRCRSRSRWSTRSAHRVGQGRPRRRARAGGRRPGRVVSVERKWVFGEPPLPDDGRAGRGAPRAHRHRALVGADEPGARSAGADRARRTAAARGAGAGGSPPPRRRSTPATPTGACTSTTATTSATTTRASPATRSSSTRATTKARTARWSSRSATRGRPGSCTAGSSRCSSTACCRSSTARSGWRARPPSSRSGSGARHRCSRRSSFRAERVVDDRRITAHAELLLGDDLLCEAHMLAAKGDHAALPAVSARRA